MHNSTLDFCAFMLGMFWNRSSVFFDVDKIADTSTDLPHMLPSEQFFEQKVGRDLGISDKDNIVVRLAFSAHLLRNVGRFTTRKESSVRRASG